MFWQLIIRGTTRDVAQSAKRKAVAEPRFTKSCGVTGRHLWSHTPCSPVPPNNGRKACRSSLPTPLTTNSSTQ